MMDWFRGGAKADESDASDDLLKQGDKERDAGDLTAALHFYGKALAVAGSPEKRKSALLAQSRTYTLNGDLVEAEEAATRALDLGVCAPSLVRRGCARRKMGHFGAAYEDLRRAAQLDPQNREARDEIRRLHAAAQRRQKFESEAQRDAEAEQLRAILPADVVDAVVEACRGPFYAEASVAPGLGYELNAAIARVRDDHGVRKVVDRLYRRERGRLDGHVAGHHGDALVRIGRRSTGDDRHVKSRIHALVVAQREPPGPGAGVVPHLRVPQPRRRDRRQDHGAHRRVALTRGRLQLGCFHRSLEPREVPVEEEPAASADDSADAGALSSGDASARNASATPRIGSAGACGTVLQERVAVGRLSTDRPRHGAARSTASAASASAAGCVSPI